MKKIIVFGGSGFIGRYIVKNLAENGHIIKIFSRNQAKSLELKVCSNVGQISCISGSVLDTELVKKHLMGMDIAINLVGLLHEGKVCNFDSVHSVAAENIAKYAKDAEVKQLIHFSALGVGNGSKYNASKRRGEALVKGAFTDAIIVRPSVVFGEEDRFFNKFARLARFLPCLPIVGEGKAIMQPVYVVDVAEFVSNIVEQNVTRGIFELVGPKRYSFKELMQFVLKSTGRKRFLLNLSFSLAKILAWKLELRFISFLLKPLTGDTEPMLTRDQVELLKYDNISDNNALEMFCIEAKSIEEIVPMYLN